MLVPHSFAQSKARGLTMDPGERDVSYTTNPQSYTRCYT